MKNSITNSLVLCGIGVIIYAMWQGLELLFEGEIVASSSDSIMAVILMWSLYGNYCSYIKDSKVSKD